MLAQFKPHYDSSLAQFGESYAEEQGDAIFINGIPSLLSLSPISGQIIDDVSPPSGEIVINGNAASLSLFATTGSVIVGSIAPPVPPINTDFPAWLQDQSAIRCILVEAVVKSGSEQVRYLSSRPFKTSSTDTPANTIYAPIVKGSSVRTVERINVSGDSASLSFGDIELDNTDGSLDSWLADVWSNRQVNVLLGDVRWDRSDYQIIFSGVLEDIGSRGRGSLNLKLRDKLQRLNTPVTEATLGGSTANKAQLIPLTFGECHNIFPLLTNPSTLEYQFHDGTSERLIEVRDNGVPVAANESLGAGKFTLPVQPFGRITASAQGSKPAGTWLKTAAEIIERLVTAYGSVESRFDSGDIDGAHMSAFNAANPQPLGVYMYQRENLLSICGRIAASVGARLVMSREGKLRLIKVELPAPGTAFEITTDDVLIGSLRVVEKLTVQAGFRLGYAKNWAVQDPLDTRIPNEHKDLYAREWLSATAKDDNVKSEYKIDGEPERQDTFLLTDADASAEANRLLDLFKVPRYVVSFEATARCLQLELGQAINITYPRFGLDAGKSGMVVGLSPDWDRARMSVEVLI